MPEVREFVVGFISVIIGIVVGVTLLPVINTAITDANLTGTQATLAQLIPTLVAVGLVTYAVKSLI
mgnify:CR=1 FL=1